MKDIRALKEEIEKNLVQVIPTLGEKTKLRDACEYALLGGGKRIRPLIVMMVAEGLRKNQHVMSSALAVEFFHSASLIADDLPCMDNDEERRSKPSLHKVYDESIAILASYTLISLGYEYIYKNSKILQENGIQSANEACVLGLKTVTQAAGIFGATNGQFLDLFPPNHSLETIKKIIYQKTITLFEISFVLGWVFGGGDLRKIDDVKKLAYHLGMAFQIGDDLNDVFQDKKHATEVNIVNSLGMDISLKLYHEEMEHFRMGLKNLCLNTENFCTFTDILQKKQLEGAESAPKR